MQKAIIAKVDEGLLDTTAADSDRFVYSNYVMPLLVTYDDNVTPIVPFYKRKLLNAFAHNGVIDGAQLKRALSGLGVGELVANNELEFGPRPPRPDAGEDAGGRAETARIALKDAGHLLNMIGSNDSLTEEVLRNAASAKLELARVSLGRTPARLKPAPPAPPTVDEMIQFLIGLLQSDVAHFFLDRTRILPKGFRVGEHVYGLSLAPGEEVTLEQKTFTKRQTTYEEQNQQEAEFDLELASTLTTELQEGFERQKAITDTWGMNVGKTGSYSSPIISDVAYGSFNTNHTFGYSKNVTDADQETRRRSTNDSHTASAKVASKYRAMHRTTFSVSAEQGFESTTKRVVRNPNAFTPVTLHYFKILQRVELRHERYGVRLGWMPSVKDPAYRYFDQIRVGKQQILDKAEAALPPKPEDPTATRPAGGANQEPDTKWFASELIEAGNGAADGSMSADINVDIAFADDFEWDGKTENINVQPDSIRSPNKYHADLKGLPTVVPGGAGTGSALRVTVHVGAQEDAFRRAMIELQVSALFVRKPVQTAIPTDSAAAEQMAANAVAVRDWEAKCEELRSQARKAADDWEALMLRNLNPVAEMISQLTKDPYFPPNVRDEAWEIDLWQKLFDWERAGYVTYPGWWADGPLRDPTRDPSDFINASWARLYLPVRVGMERLALRWIYGRTTRAINAATEARFDVIEEDLKKYRKNHFGDEMEMMPPQAGAFQEQFDTIATWSDLMPTDGTHLEVVQAATMAADEVTMKEAEDASKLRKAFIASQQQDERLKDKAYNQMTQPATVEVKIKPYAGPDRSS